MPPPCHRSRKNHSITPFNHDRLTTQSVSLRRFLSRPSRFRGGPRRGCGRLTAEYSVPWAVMSSRGSPVAALYLRTSSNQDIRGRVRSRDEADDVALDGPFVNVDLHQFRCFDGVDPGWPGFSVDGCFRTLGFCGHGAAWTEHPRPDPSRTPRSSSARCSCPRLGCSTERCHPN